MNSILELLNEEIEQLTQELIMSYQQNSEWTYSAPLPVERIAESHLGYDIESQESANNKTERLIEVKASKGSFKNAKATISKKQTTMALSSKNYYFHFWDISDEYDPKLAIIDGKKIADQAPKEIKAGKLKEWTYAFKEFRDEFFDPKITI